MAEMVTFFMDCSSCSWSGE